jgi:hypothetical protein
MLEEKGAINRNDLNNFIPDGDIEAERTAERTALVKRVLRIHVPGGREEDED